MKDNLLPSSLLILIWAYTGLEKFIHFEESKRAFHNQVFPEYYAELLSYGVPTTELVVVILLLFRYSRWMGFLLSLITLTAFTTYIGLVWIEVFPRVPCSCAGIFERVSWSSHLIINLVLVLISCWGLMTTKAPELKI
jgi:hypothetical protein